MRILITILLTLLAGAAAALTYVYSGGFDIAADQPHDAWIDWVAETARERSIAVRAQRIDVPNLDDPKLIAEGASEYSQMCAGCHLAPGVQDNELRPGLYPPPPELAKQGNTRGDATAAAARQFWIIKHGIKMSAMPGLGPDSRRRDPLEHRRFSADVGHTDASTVRRDDRKRGIGTPEIRPRARPRHGRRRLTVWIGAASFDGG